MEKTITFTGTAGRELDVTPTRPAGTVVSFTLVVPTAPKADKPLQGQDLVLPKH